MSRKISRKKIILLALLLSALFSIPVITIFYSPFTNLWHKIIRKEKPQPYITIFVHGTFNSLLGFFDTYKVIKDELPGTDYKKIVSQTRKDPYFYHSQPILQKGLIKLEPSFDLAVTNSKKHAAYPIIKAYNTIQELISPDKEKNYFYTLGWSGYISQQRRRFESVRFYNIVSQEVERFHKLGIKPKIRILCHSHGGNLILNFGAIKTILNLNDKDLDEISETDDERESLYKTLEIIKKLPTQQEASNKNGLKKYDYIPTDKDLVIDELIMFGNPIQPETETFVYNDLFKKVYNFYSDEDYVQASDWVSTKKLYSKQRLETTRDNSNFVQAKIMIGRNVQKENKNLDQTKTYTIISNAQQDNTASFTKNIWDKIISLKNLFIKKSEDPTHKEFWFATWNKETILSPLPIVVFTPMLLNIIENNKQQTTDLDLNLDYTNKKLHFYLLGHQQTKVQNKKHIQRHIIEQLKTKVQRWKPENFSYAKEFEIMNEYIKSAKNS